MIVECRTDAPRVTYGEHLARARQTTHHVATIIVFHGGTQHVGHLYVVVDIVGNVRTLQSLFLSLNKQTLYFAVQSVSHQFERDIRVAIDARRLTLCRQETKNLVDVGHIEITTQTEVLGTPVISTKERVNIL